MKQRELKEAVEMFNYKIDILIAGKDIQQHTTRPSRGDEWHKDSRLLQK